MKGNTPISAQIFDVINTCFFLPQGPKRRIAATDLSNTPWIATTGATPIPINAPSLGLDSRIVVSLSSCLQTVALLGGTCRSRTTSSSDLSIL